MPTEYANKYMKVQCNDCLHKCMVPFHIMGGKCKKCRSYNTARMEGELVNQDELSSVEEGSG
jgi:hypothetical protein